MTNAEDILIATIQVLEQRGKHYTNDEERNMRLIVEIFNSITGQDLTVMQGWHFMLCLKLIRAAQDPAFKLDHYVDLAGYAALAAEEGEREISGETTERPSEAKETDEKRPCRN